MRNSRKSQYLFFKRLADVLIASGSLVVLSPVFAALAIAVKLDSPGPVFYRQKRLGKNGKSFYLYKFRSMQKDADAKLQKYLDSNPAAKKEWDDNFKLDDDPRITRVGKILRVTSLDELPQLVNIIKGEMALIGPRPIVEAEVAKHYKGGGRRKSCSASRQVSPATGRARVEVPPITPNAESSNYIT